MNGYDLRRWDSHGRRLPDAAPPWRITVGGSWNTGISYPPTKEEFGELKSRVEDLKKTVAELHEEIQRLKQ